MKGEEGKQGNTRQKEQPVDTCNGGEVHGGLVERACCGLGTGHERGEGGGGVLR